MTSQVDVDGETSLSLQEAVEATGMSVSTLRRRIRDGAFPNVVRGEAGAYRIPVVDLVAAGLTVPTSTAGQPTGPQVVHDQAPSRVVDLVAVEEAASLRERLARAEAEAQARTAELERERSERIREREAAAADLARERAERDREREAVARDLERERARNDQLVARNDELTGTLVRELAARRPAALLERAEDADVVEDADVLEEPATGDGGVEAPSQSGSSTSSASPRETFRTPEPRRGFLARLRGR